MKVAIRALSCVLGASLALCAASFWEDSPPERWTASQIERLVLDSPWARPAEVDFVGARSAPSTFPGGRSPRGTGLPGGGTRFPAPFPGTGGWGFTEDLAASPDADVVARWESAWPVQQALAAAANAAPAPFDPEHRILALTSLPFGVARLAEEPDRILSGTALLRKSGPQIRARRVEIVPQPGAPGVRLFFPRDMGLEPDEKTLELVMQLEDYQVVAKFKLKEMLFRGRLEM